jgi:hypothetical protein
MKKPNLNFLKRISIMQVIVLVVAIALAIPAFILTRNFVVSWQITDLPGVAVKYDNQGQAQAASSTEVATPADPGIPEENLPSWDGSSRVTLLFIGLDERDWETGQGAPRSDTMILFTIDPVSKTAGMLSIPRDMWVNIPGFGYSRINTAYSSGEGAKLPGGGPGLAVKTVEQFIGVPIQYYAQVDFKAFEEAIYARVNGSRSIQLALNRRSR